MARRGHLRASDSDREQIAERLRHATAEGRLSTDELEHRLTAALSARTYAELDVLIADLPGKSLARRARHRSELSTVLRPALALAVAIPVALAVVATVAVVVAGVVALWWVWMIIAWWYFARHHRHRGGPYRGARRYGPPHRYHAAHQRSRGGFWL